MRHNVKHRPHRLRLYHKKQSGMVLLLVLMIFALAATIAGQLSYESHREVRRTANILHINESYLLARAGETFAIEKLLTDQSTDLQTGLDIDYLTERWAVESSAFEEGESGNRNSLSSGQLVQDDFLDEEAGSSASNLQDIGQLSIVIEDLQGRFNINNVQYNKPGHNSGTKQLNFVLNEVIAQGVQEAQSVSSGEAEENVAEDFDLSSSNVGSTAIELDVSVSDISLAIRDWVDLDKESVLVTGAEDDFYQQRQPPYRAANQNVFDVSELMAIKGFEQNDFELYELIVPKRLSMQSDGASSEDDGEPEEAEDDIVEQDQLEYDAEGNVVPLTEVPSALTQWGGISHHFSALPFPTKINVNTASEIVLNAIFTADQAQKIVSGREGSPYQKVDDIFLNLEDIKPEDKEKHTHYLSVNSDYYLVTSIAVIEETKFVLKSKLFREPGGRVRVLSRDFSQ